MTAVVSETTRRTDQMAIVHLPVRALRRKQPMATRASALGNRHPQEAEHLRPPARRRAEQEVAIPTLGTTQTTTCTVVVAALLLQTTLVASGEA